ncbi:GntR family transcriptional regulator [Agrobacterium vitis]|uniref:GntR family transcriptional regulator n=1 Tax=Allorhizobium ampelinum TaxID=3025782 RepID=UPI001F1E56AF|nr:GntR family transcriptional regulator [Allorhizobium ampelinum]MCF1464809.1 GntR family transcriptional regulator [Allorhizobium ampelinum]
MAKLLQTGEPYYLQIADRLREIVAHLPAGERLPSEPVLAKSFKVSRFTVAKAVEQLTNDGLIYRKQGSGTFVAEAPLRRQPGYLLSFTEAVQAAGHRAGHKVLQFGPVGWATGLPYGSDEPLLVLDRLRLVDGIAVARHRSVLSAALAARVGLTEKVVGDPEFSLYAHFSSKGLQVSAANERLIARLASAEEMQLLKLSQNTVVVSVSRQTFADDGTVLDAVDATYDARHYSYEARLTREPGLGNKKTIRELGYDNKTSDPDGHNGPRLGPWGNERGGSR